MASNLHQKQYSTKQMTRLPSNKPEKETVNENHADLTEAQNTTFDSREIMAKVRTALLGYRS